MATVDNTASTVEGYEVEYREKSYTFAGEAAATVVQMISVRAGEKVLDVILRTAALGAGATVASGDGTSTAGYTAASSANTAQLIRGTGALLVGPNEYTVDDTLDLLTAGAASTGVVTLGAWIQKTFD